MEQIAKRHGAAAKQGKPGRLPDSRSLGHIERMKQRRGVH